MDDSARIIEAIRSLEKAVYETSKSQDIFQKKLLAILEEIEANLGDHSAVVSTLKRIQENVERLRD
jgi:hypothetical protein